jgi:hypothetical protein
MGQRIALIATVALCCLGVMATTAAANPPERSATLQFTHTDPDFFAGSGQNCAFPVLGSWDVTLETVTFFDASTGNPVRVVTYLSYTGTLSNPLTGKSVPDASNHASKITDYYAPDGTFLQEDIIESRADRYIHFAYHLRADANGNIVFDSGRDWLMIASRPVDIQPLCAALS